MPTRIVATKHLSAAIFALSVMLAAGCRNDDGEPLWSQIKELQAERTELKLQTEKLDAENKRLTEQIDTLASLTREVRIEALDTVKDIEISKRTGFYDKDNDGTKETLVVYLRVIDEAGDAVKMTGAVEVQLWDLNAPEAQALLATWEVAPEELTKLWASTAMTSYYRLTFDAAGVPPADRRELTVKVAFTDYLTGKVLRRQAVVKP